jgi:MoaA/NifB/PqqE/SkfB family radical SAM enzyme
MGCNLDEIVELTRKYGKKEGVTGISFQPLMEITPQTKDLWVYDIEGLTRTVDALTGLRKDGYRILNSISNLRQFIFYFEKRTESFWQPCTLGYRNLFIDQYGGVSLCNQFPAIGNVRDSSLKDIYYSQAARSQRAAIRQCKKVCMATCYVKRSISEKCELFKNLFLRRECSR